MHRQTRDLTEGRPLPLLVSFSLPLMVGNVFQQMYTVVDTAVVGKALGGWCAGGSGCVRLAELDDAGRDSGA